MAAPAITLAARSGSASGSTMEAFSPPISAWLGMPRPVAATATWRPTATEPVKDRQSNSSTIAAAVAGGGPAGQHLEQVAGQGRGQQLGQLEGEPGRVR